MRHAFRILAELGAECDRLGVRAVDERGESGPASEFLAKIIHYIEARERECDRATLTDAEREALTKVVRRIREDYFAGRFADSVQIAAVIDGLLERAK
jgi:chromosome condensin MukBEF ATPase and DNA-binding subunit MukB